MADLKPIAEMMDAEVDRNLAELRGWTDFTSGYLDGSDRAKCHPLPGIRRIPRPTTDPAAACELRGWWLTKHPDVSLTSQMSSFPDVNFIAWIGMGGIPQGGRNSLMSAEARAILAALREESANG